MNIKTNLIIFSLALLMSPLLHACATVATGITGSVCPNGSVIFSPLDVVVTCNPPVSVIDAGNPIYGFTIINPDNTITYTSFSNASTDSFVYTVEDNIGNTATGPITVFYNPQPSITDYTTNTCYNITLNDTVPGASGGTPPYTYSVTSVLNGTATFTDSLGDFQFIPTLNFAGLAIVQYQVTDSLGCTSDIHSILIYVGPNATNQNFSTSPLSDSLSNYVQGGVSPYTFAIISQVNGTVKLKIDRQHYTFTLNSGQTSGSFTFQVTDQNGCSAEATVTVVLP
jgi:large repetitive protein